jgi:hypothetical protein
MVSTGAENFAVNSPDVEPHERNTKLCHRRTMSRILVPHSRLWNLQLHVYITPFLCQLIVLCIYLVFDQTIWNSRVTYCCKIHALVWRVGLDSSGKSEFLLVPTRGQSESNESYFVILLHSCLVCEKPLHQGNPWTFAAMLYYYFHSALCGSFVIMWPINAPTSPQLRYCLLRSLLLCEHCEITETYRLLQMLCLYPSL